MANEITAQELKEQINDIITDLKQFISFLDYGATLKEYCDTKQNLINNFEGFIKDLDNYSNQESLKELERLRNEIF